MIHWKLSEFNKFWVLSVYWDERRPLSHLSSIGTDFLLPVSPLQDIFITQDEQSDRRILQETLVSPTTSKGILSKVVEFLGIGFR